MKKREQIHQNFPPPLAQNLSHAQSVISYNIPLQAINKKLGVTGICSREKGFLEGSAGLLFWGYDKYIR